MQNLKKTISYFSNYINLHKNSDSLRIKIQKIYM